MYFSSFTDALLADLQNTVSPGSGGIGGSSPGYGSLNKTSRQSPGSETPSSKIDSYNSSFVSFTTSCNVILMFGKLFNLVIQKKNCRSLFLEIYVSWKWI